MICSDLINSVLDLFFPRYCQKCGQAGDYLCSMCLLKIEILKQQECPKCFKKNNLGYFCNNYCKGEFCFDQLIGCFDYHENPYLKRLIHLFKYKFCKELSANFASLLVRQFASTVKISKKTPLIIVPVPSHKIRIKFRGFNQARVLAEMFFKELRKFKKIRKQLYFADCLVRKSFFSQQAKLDRIKRQKNLLNTIEVKPTYLELLNKSVVLLIDDVATTGATLNECSHVLKKNGVSKVVGLVLARVKTGRSFAVNRN